MKKKKKVKKIINDIYKWNSSALIGTGGWGNEVFI